MSVVTIVSALTTRIANEFRDAVKPRLLPSGGDEGQILRKTTDSDYATEWSAAPPKITIGTVTPTSPSLNDIWIDTN